MAERRCGEGKNFKPRTRSPNPNKIKDSWGYLLGPGVGLLGSGDDYRLTITGRVQITGVWQVVFPDNMGVGHKWIERYFYGV